MFIADKSEDQFQNAKEKELNSWSELNVYDCVNDEGQRKNWHEMGFHHERSLGLSICTKGSTCR